MSSQNPVSAATAQAQAVKTIARSTCNDLTNEYADLHPAQLDQLMKLIRNGSIKVLENA